MLDWLKLKEGRQKPVLPALMEDFGFLGKGRIEDQRIGQFTHAGNKYPHQLGIKLRVAAAFKFPESFFRCPCFLVGALGCDGVISVGNRDDSSAHRNLTAGEPFWIA